MLREVFLTQLCICSSLMYFSSAFYFKFYFKSEQKMIVVASWHLMRWLFWAGKPLPIICWYLSWTRLVQGHLFTCEINLFFHLWNGFKRDGSDDLVIFKLNRPNHMSISLNEIDLYAEYPAELSHLNYPVVLCFFPFIFCLI